MGYIKQSYIHKQLNFAYDIAKRLDEHREMVEAIQNKTTLFDDHWHIVNLATQDDYLMRLFYMVHDCWPEDPKCAPSATRRIRPRPEILGECQLPEYQEKTANRLSLSSEKGNQQYLHP